MQSRLAVILILLFMPVIIFAGTITFSDNPWATFTVDGCNFSASGQFTWTSNSYLTFTANYGGTITITLNDAETTFQLNSIDLKGPGYAYTVNVEGYLDAGLQHTQNFSPGGSWGTSTATSFTGINILKIINPGNSSDVCVDNINLTIENATPTNISITNNVVTDGAASGTTVGTFSTTDPHDTGDHTYTLAAGGTDNASFTISGSSLLTAFTADYDTKSSYSIKVRSTDSGSLYYEKDFTITVSEATPTFLQVTGLTNPAAANGIYEKTGTFGSMSFDYWKQQGGEYYIYADEYEGSNYWNIDGDLDDSDIIIYANMNGGPYTSPHLVPSVNWQDFGGNTASALSVVVYDESLPVELTSFSATQKGESVILTWQTASETGNLGFILERTSGNGAWQQIASYKTEPALKGKGNSSSTTNYSYIDNTVNAGIDYRYRLGDVNIVGSVTMHSPISANTNALPQSTEMFNAYPNPFNPETIIKYQLHKDSQVRITVYDILGQQVKTLIDEQQVAGSYQAIWNGISANGNKAASGAYIIRMETENKYQVQKVILMK